MFLFASDVYAGSAPVAVTIVIGMVAPVISVTTLATFARLGELMPVVVGLTAVNSVTVDIVVQAGFPLLDVSVATVVIISADGRRAAQ